MTIKDLIPFPLRQRLKGCYYALEYRKRDKYIKEKVQKYSNTFNNDQKAYLASLLVKSHVLEKGITMPERRLGFGYDRARCLIKDCQIAIERFGEGGSELQFALADLKEYLDVHKAENYKLPKDIEDGITKLACHLKIKGENCFKTTKAAYFKYTADYHEFACSRHSVRWFTEESVSKDLLMKALELSQTAPSACNRQSIRVKVIDNPEKKNVCVNIQNGNRGFGHKADKWLLLTAEIGAWGYRDINSAFIDAGIYAMSLLNALHYYGIAACALNAHLDADQMKLLQEEIGYPDSELPVLFIVIGNAPTEFMVARSRRKDVNEIVTFV